MSWFPQYDAIYLSIHPVSIHVVLSIHPVAAPVKTIRIHLVLFGMQNRTCGPYSAGAARGWRRAPDDNPAAERSIAAVPPVARAAGDRHYPRLSIHPAARAGTHAGGSACPRVAEGLPQLFNYLEQNRQSTFRRRMCRWRCMPECSWKFSNSRLVSALQDKVVHG
jgi:hypothetical protein